MELSLLFFSLFLLSLSSTKNQSSSDLYRAFASCHESPKEEVYDNQRKDSDATFGCVNVLWLQTSGDSWLAKARDFLSLPNGPQHT